MEPGKKRRPWIPPLVGLIGGVIAFLAILFVESDFIGAAGVGVIVFVITWLNARRYFR